MKLAELAQIAGAVLEGDGTVEIRGLTVPDFASGKDLVFADDERYLASAEASAAGAILAKIGSASTKPMLLVHDVRAALHRLLPLFEPGFPPLSGIDHFAHIHPQAQITESARVGPFACILAGATVGERVTVHPYAYIGENCEIGDDTILYPGATLLPNTAVGKGCRLHSGCVIGDAGFGYQFDGSSHVRIPQVGRVIVGDFVDIGANVTVDRAMVGATVIGKGTKIDNLVQIGHNVRIGDNCIIVSQTGVSGSTKIGDGVVLGGQTGIAEHVVLGDGVRTGGQSGITKSLPAAGDYWGTPARPMAETLRVQAAAHRLPELLKEIRDLKERLDEVERRLAE